MSAKRYHNGVWEPCAVKRYYKSINLLDMSKVISGYYDDHGNYEPDPDWVISDFIPVEQGKEYTFSAIIDDESRPRVFEKRVARFDVNKDFIIMEIGQDGYTSHERFYSHAYRGETDEAYIRVCFNVKNAYPMVYEGDESEAPPYEIYEPKVWHDVEEYIRGRYPNIFDVDSVQNVIRNNAATTSGFSNVDGLITLTKSVGYDGRYAYNEPLSFEANEVYELTFDVLLEGTNSSNLIAIAVLDPSNMGAVSTDLFNYSVEKDTWVNVAEELTLSATQGALSIQARNTGNSVKIKNVILRKKGDTWNEQ